MIIDKDFPGLIEKIGYYYEFIGDIISDENIEIKIYLSVTGSIKAVGSIEAEGWIEAGGWIKVGGWIRSGGSIKAVGSIKAGGSIEANKIIFFGIESKSIILFVVNYGLYGF